MVYIRTLLLRLLYTKSSLNTCSETCHDYTIVSITFVLRSATVDFCRRFPLFILAIKGSQKKSLIAKHSTHKKDTGSPEVQIAILTEEIKYLTDHLKEHLKDHSARRGLLGKVARRRTLLNYLRMNKPDSYQASVEANGLKK